MQSPDFIGVGGHKCGSTWLSEVLRGHPDVFMSNPKEIGYYTKYQNKGLDWYLSHFSEANKNQVKGEFSATYLYSERIAKNVFNDFKNVKIICLVRKPEDRTISHIKQLIRKNLIDYKQNKKIDSELLQKWIVDFPEIIDYSVYFKYITNYINLFGRSNVLILRQENLLLNPKQELIKVYNFLTIRDFESPLTNKVISKGIIPKNKFLEKLRIKTYNYFFYNNPRIISLIKKSGLADFYRNFNQKDVQGQSVEFEQEAEAYLKKILIEDWKKTLKLLT